MTLKVCLFLVTFVLLFVACIGMIIPKKKEDVLGNAAASLLLMITILFTLLHIGKIQKDEAIANEVPLSVVPLKGERQFIAMVEITYRNGDLKTVELVPNSTHSK